MIFYGSGPQVLCPQVGVEIARSGGPVPSLREAPGWSIRPRSDQKGAEAEESVVSLQSGPETATGTPRPSVIGGRGTKREKSISCFQGAIEKQNVAKEIWGHLKLTECYFLPPRGMGHFQ